MLSTGHHGSHTISTGQLPVVAEAPVYSPERTTYSFVFLIELRFPMMAYGFFRELLEMSRISSSHVSVAVREILFKKIDGASKNNNFQKMFIKKDSFVEEISYFQE